jgi:tRNA (cmo5U34)-methyltransferase
MLMLWTSTFIPLEYRAQLFRDARAMIGPRGALFVADKLRGQTAAFQTALASEYANWKHSMGYSPSMIDAKARALEGVLVPMNAPEQKALISNEGWNVEEVTRYLGFASWYCLPR